jgi:hypothetical protein
MTKPLQVTARIPANGRISTVRGRAAWALLELLKAGATGCTPIEHPGPRWSAYVFNLKRKYGLEIETVYESHGGHFAGSHARYVLHSPVEIICRSETAELASA